MAEPTNGGTAENKPQPKKELSMELRLLFAFILMGVVLFTTPYFYKSIAPPPTKKLAPITEPAAKPPSPVVPPPDVAPVSAQKEGEYVIDTDLYRVTFSNRGAVVRSWLLKKYKAHTGRPLELLNPASKIDFPFSFYFKNQKPPANLNQALYAAKLDSDGVGITFEYSDGHVVARKSFHFHKSTYLSQITTQVSEDGKNIAHLIEWRGGFGDLAVANPAGNQQVLHYDAADNKLVKTAAKAAKDGPVSSSGNYSFAGIEDTYFTAAFLPEGSSTVETMTFSDSVPTVLEQKEQPFAGTAVSDGAVNRFSVFVGPKDIDTLRKVNPKLEQLVDFGWFALLAKPLFLAVNWVNDQFVHNYGWSIILVTIAINFILFPLKLTSMKSMKKMQALQPQIAVINEKYKNVSIRDPRKAEQNQEVMDLYKKHGVNPMGGCVPMILQIPFFIAFYKVFSVSVEMRGASWLWVTDLSQPEQLPIKVLPLLMIVSQFAMQKMTPSTSVDPNQQRMMLIMPLVFGFMFYNFSSGLVLYYLTSNLVGIAQQLFFNRTATAADAVQSVQVKKKKNGRK